MTEGATWIVPSSNSRRRKRPQPQTHETVVVPHSNKATTTTCSVLRTMTLLVVLFVGILPTTVLAGQQPTTTTTQQKQPYHNFQRMTDRTKVVPDTYLVVLHNMDDLRSIMDDYNLPRPEQVYRRVFTGFAVQGLTAAVRDALLADDRVHYLAEDGWLEQEDDEYYYEEGYFDLQVQSSAPWHLDRIDGTGGDDTFWYLYNGDDVSVYILDSGIRATHTDFWEPGSTGGTTSRIAVDCFEDIGPCNTDQTSHGTHVASLAGGLVYGVAKGITIHDVRIRDANNALRWAYLFAGMDYVIAQQQASPSQKLIANLSYSGGSYPIADEAAQQMLDAGIILVAAAGNQAGDACDRSPGRVPGVISVGSMGEGDVRAPSSNAGSCISLWAPGRDIVAAGIVSDTATLTKSGTSMASPLVAGATALYLAAGLTVDDLLADAENIEALGDDDTTDKLLSLRLLNQGGSHFPTVPPVSEMPSSQPTWMPSSQATTEMPSQTSAVVSTPPTQFPTFAEPPSTAPTKSPIASSPPTFMPSVSKVPTISATPTESTSPTMLPSVSVVPTEQEEQPSHWPTTDLPRFGGGGGDDDSVNVTATPTQSPSQLIQTNTIETPSSGAWRPCVVAANIVVAAVLVGFVSLSF